MISKAKLAAVLGLSAAVSLLATAALGQDYRMHRSTNDRAGLPTVGATTPALTTPVTYNNPGRAFLRWWNPLLSQESQLDNDDNLVGSPGGVSAAATGVWDDPAANPAINVLAFNFVQKATVSTPYRMTRSVAQTLATSDPRSGATATYTWTYNNLLPGEEYQLFVNIPIGPTGNSTLFAPSDFPQRFYVYDVQGATGGTEIEVIDTFQSGGGLVRLGDDGAETNRVFIPTGTTLTITLYNTAPRGSSGALLDPQAAPGAEYVYADSALLTSDDTTDGAYQATPVVAELSAAPPTGASALNALFNHRVIGARNETMELGELARQANLATVSSYLFDGAYIDPLDTSRLNVAWSWPVARPFDTSEAERNRYNTERRDWLFGPNLANARHTVRHMRDNRAATTSISGAGFVAGSLPALGSFFGPDYYSAPVVTGGATGGVAYDSNLPDGFYHVQAWMPDADTGAGLTMNAQYEIYQGLTLIDTLELDQSTSSGWVSIPGQPTEGYESNPTVGELRVVVTNNSADAGDLGREVYADAIRFTAPAEITVSSTPIFGTTTIDDGVTTTTRDVVVVATEDGKINCIDAHGDRTTGGPPQVYWTFPTEDPSGDPNGAASEDGGISEMPTGFNLSSGLIANVGGTDYLFIGSENGRVYCIDMQGRGDGTTRRVWTYPDDYDPTDPTGPRQLPLEPINGSVTFGDVGGTPAIFVPTGEGRMLALDAAGTPATKTTSLLWQYPDPNAPYFEAPLGPIDMTPTYSFGRLYFGAPEFVGATESLVWGINTATGRPDWDSNTAAGIKFAMFGNASFAAVPGGLITGGGAAAGLDALIVADDAGELASFDPATGALRWNSTEVAGGASASLSFTHLTVYNNIGILNSDVPAVIVPTFGGSLVGFLIDGSVNSAGNRRIWQYDLAGGDQVASVATGGWRNGDFRSWMYTGDSAGIFYAFNGNDDITPNPVFPGEPPGQEVLPENDPTESDLQSILDPDKIVLLSPETYEAVYAELSAGTLTPAGAAAYVASGSVTRRNFEVGETLYLFVYDMPDLAASPTIGNYYLEFIFESQGRKQRRQIQVRDAGPSAVNSKVCLAPVPILATGNTYFTPGPATVTVRAVPTGRQNLASTEVAMSPPAQNGQITVANPLSLVFPDVGITAPGADSNGVGFTTDAAAPFSLVNGSPGIDATSTSNGPIKETQGAISRPGGLFGTVPAAAGDDVAHASTGTMTMQVYDRSLSFLVFGPNRGLQGVRINGDDMAWQIRDSGGTVQSHRNTHKPLILNTGTTYPGFEELPGIEPNGSLDYPDIDRSNLSAVRSVFGRAENPFYSGVSLQPPSVGAAALTTYRTTAGFEAQMTRTLSSTVFNMQLAIPRYQPASGPIFGSYLNRPGYRGYGAVYVDAGGGGFNNNDANRTFNFGVRVGADEKLSIGTPTVDLGSLPSGGGFNGGAALGGPGGRGPELPWNAGSAFRPYNNEFDNMYQDFEVYNEGNVNMLNVRVSKAFDRTDGLGINRLFRPLELFAPGLHELAWLDGPLHLFSSLDPLYSETGPNRAATDPEARNILQKPRPGDVSATRLSTNPVRRTNANIGAVGGTTLLNSAVFPAEDPKVGVSAPIGTPVGDYIRQIWVFEDSLGSNGATPETPSLGPRQTGGPLSNNDIEAFSDPAITLKFTLREARLTNRPTTKSAPNVDNLVTGNESFFWQNYQPTALRDGFGNLVVAWTSDRLDAGNNAAFGARPKTAGDTALQPLSRIFVGSLAGSDPSVSSGSSPVRDLNNWGASTNGRWFNHSGILPATATPATIFSIGSLNLDATTLRFHSPSLPTAGSVNPLSSATGIRPSQTERYITFLGEGEASDGSGLRKSVTQLFITRLETAANGTVNQTGAHVPLPFDPLSRKSKASIVQQGSIAQVMYTSYSSGSGELMVAGFDGTNWNQPERISTGNAFERIGQPSAQLRRYQNGDTNGVIEYTFTGKRRGRSNGEAFMGRMFTNSGGVLLAPTAADVHFGPRLDQISVDPATRVFWAPGAHWRLMSADLDLTGTSYIDVFRQQGTTYVSILDQNSRKVDKENGIITMNTTLGGQVEINTRNGSLQFTGAVIPRTIRMFVRYAPKFVKVSDVDGANYRTADMAFDDRLLGVYVDPSDSSRNLLGDLSYWADQNGLTPAANDPIRWDRMLFTFTRTSGDGAQSVRPYIRSMRFGVQLPTPVALNPDGTIFGTFTVEWTSGIPAANQVAVSERYYQIDPATGRVYFPSGAEDKQVRITYQGVDSAGNLLPQTAFVTYAVDLIKETEEQTVPIEQAANENDLTIALDPSNTAFNGADYRRPGLVWMFWSSTRAGTRDIYFQTVAPRFSIRRPTR